MFELNLCNTHTHVVKSVHIITLVVIRLLLLVTKQKRVGAVEYFYIRLILQSTFSLIVMFVCSYKIVTAPENDGQKPVYWSALTGTAASWLPSPVKAPEDGQFTDDFDRQITKIERKPEE